jgi:hypothetical protein
VPRRHNGDARNDGSFVVVAAIGLSPGECPTLIDRRSTMKLVFYRLFLAISHPKVYAALDTKVVEDVSYGVS